MFFRRQPNELDSRMVLKEKYSILFTLEDVGFIQGELKIMGLINRKNSEVWNRTSDMQVLAMWVLRITHVT